MSETIDRAAISHNGGVFDVPRPGRHHDVIALMRNLGIPAPIRGLQGFITSAGRFVDRMEAATIATVAGQIKEKTGPTHVLFSEDMW